MCPHGGSLNIIAASPRVTVTGMPVALLNDQGMVAGCTFMVGQKPQFCVTTQWLVGATRVLANGTPVLINPVGALCMSADQIPGGPPNVTSSQTRVIAT